MNATIKSLYHEARAHGYKPAHALMAARTVFEFYSIGESHVRIQASEEQESYFDVHGREDGYVNQFGRRVSAEDAQKELEAIIERDGCWVVYSESNCPACGEWKVIDSVGMCAGYADPTDWRQNSCVPDLMRAAIDAYESAVCKS